MPANVYQAPAEGERSGIDLSPSLLANRQGYDDLIWGTITNLAGSQGQYARRDTIHRDVFSLLYKVEPELAPQAPPQHEAEWDAAKRLWDSGVFEGLRARTKLHPLFSWVVSIEMALQVKGLMTQIEEWKRNGTDIGGIDPGVTGAVAGIEEKIDNAQAATEQLGLGCGRSEEESAPPSRTYMEQALRFMQALQNQKMLQLFQWIGRLKPISRRSRHEHWSRKPRRMVGVTHGKNIARQTPYARALWVNKKTRKLWEKNQCEGGNQQYKLDDREVEGKGPFIVLLDKSGSMGVSEKDAWATACALQLQSQAEADGRDFIVIPYRAYAIGAGGTIRRADKPWQPYHFPKGKPNGAYFIELYQTSPSGGTVGWNAFAAAWAILDTYEDMKQADIVNITDGYTGLGHPETAAKIREENQKRNARLWQLMTVDCDWNEARAVTDEEYILAITDLRNDQQTRKVFDTLASI